jgi:beta-glucosidase
MLNNFSRRTFARILAGSAAALTFPRVESAANSASASAQENNKSSLSFPNGFLWGSATAAYQVEGAVREAGRGLSIWDTFSHASGNTLNGATGDIADDFFHLYKEDIRLMKELGLKTFRFSVSWPRVFPSGAGTPNPQGLDFYHRLVDALLEAGIQPFCTLYHWDLPQALQDKGGWENRDTAKVFAD